MMTDVRMPAVAGAFYPADADALAEAIDALLCAAPAGERPPKAIIAPHAGYAYSGAVAAVAYARLATARDTIRRVVLLGPAHRVAVRGLALPGAAALRTPLGDVPVDRRAAREALTLPFVCESPVAHAREHSIEVQLPFLQRALGAFTLVPFAVGDATPQEVGAVLDMLWGGAETCVVISSDLSHFLPYARAREVDAETADAIEALLSVEDEQACGAAPVNGLLHVARARGLRVERLALQNSGDATRTRGDVVGYGAFAAYEEAP